MKLFDEIEIVWKGEKHHVKPTLELIQKIERMDGYSLVKISSRMGNGDIPLSMLAVIYQVILTHAGVKGVIADDVYQAFYDQGSDELMGAAYAFLAACFPKSSETKTEKKPQ